MSEAKCRTCQRALVEGDTAWADDWRVLDVSGQSARWRTEVRYECDDCHSLAEAAR